MPLFFAAYRERAIQLDKETAGRFTVNVVIRCFFVVLLAHL